jgi:predicted Zn finger-like uncharacterized protein
MIEVQCTSCHTRYRIDEQVLPEGLPTFKCSRCGHVFSFEPRKSRLNAPKERAALKPERETESVSEPPARMARQPEPTESPSRAVDRIARKEPPSAQELAEAKSAVSEPLPSDAAGSSVQSELLKSEQAAKGSQRSVPSPSDSGHPTAEKDRPQQASAGRSVPPPELAAEQARRFYSRLFTGNDPEAVPGENLSFDFTDEQPGPDQAKLVRRGRRQASEPLASGYETPRWQVGDDESTATSASASERDPFSEENLSRPARRRTRAGQTGPKFTDDEGFIDEDEAPVYNRRRLHSSRFFILLIFLIGVGFGAMTLLIHSAPSASSAVLSYLPLVGNRFSLPTTPAKLVALREVNAAYQQGKAGPNALVISGLAENVGTAQLRVVQLTAVLRDAQRRSLGSQAVYCGNNVSPAIISQMTPHEIEFLQKLEPAKTFSLEPSASCRFVAVFMNPPARAHAYDVSVSQAIPGTAAASEEPGS